MKPLPLYDTVTIEPKSGFSADGEPTFGASFTAKCRYERNTQYPRTGESANVLTDAVIFFDSATPLSPGDKVSVGAYSGTIIVIEPMASVVGDSNHIEAFTRSL